MDKSVYTGVAISPALDWNYKMGDFGTEELTLASGFPVVPRWAVYYPVNAVETIQQLPNNYVSLESAENMLHQVGELQGFDFDNISVDSETGNMKVNGLVDTKETIMKIEPYNANWGNNFDDNAYKVLNRAYEVFQKTGNVVIIVNADSRYQWVGANYIKIVGTSSWSWTSNRILYGIGGGDMNAFVWNLKTRAFRSVRLAGNV